MLRKPVEITPATALGRTHFIGVGGVSMSGIARLLAERGHTVSGCDREESRALEPLRSAGVEVMIGHDEAHLGDIDTVVFNSAVTPLNQAELERAQHSGIRMLHRSAALASLMTGKRGIGISGSHGKTTTTGMVIDALATLDPSYMVGSTLATSGVGAKDGTGE
ncbi:MAG: Mur ligase domain-containing protein, partial [Propionibacteriaceae bacterium]